MQLGARDVAERKHVLFGDCTYFYADFLEYPQVLQSKIEDQDQVILSSSESEGILLVSGMLFILIR